MDPADYRGQPPTAAGPCQYTVRYPPETDLGRIVWLLDDPTTTLDEDDPPEDVEEGEDTDG